MSAAAGQAAPGVAPTGPPNAPRLPGHLAAHPRLSQWIALGADGTATVTPGKVEIGQGIVTALASVVAGELALPPARVRMVPASTATSPNEAVTSGSLSMQESGAALRHVAAQLRTRLVEAAAARWGVAPEGLRVDDGRVLDGAGRALGYGELAAALDPGELADPAFVALAAPGALVPDAPRRDLPDKVFGRARFIHDLALPGLLHGRVVRPPSPAATLRALDEARVRACPGLLALVRDGRFLGVVCAREHEAQAAARVLAQAASWDEPATLPDANALPAWLKAQRSEPRVVDDTGHADAEHAPDAVDTRSGTRGGARAADGAPSGSRVSAQEAPSATRRFTARYSKPFIAHASIGPSCAIARRDGDALHVWSHAQGPFNLRADLAIAFGLRADAVVVEHVEGAGCYGHNPADDVAYDAARLAAEVPGRPVRVLWSRADELAWCAFGSAMTVELDAMVDAHGRLAQWRHESWSAGHGLRPGRAGTPTLLGSWHLAKPFPVLPAFDASPASGGGSDRNAAPAYRVPVRRVVAQRVIDVPMRTSALRSLGAFANVFAIESFVDEIARATGADPLAFRLAHLDDPRAAAVLERVACMCGWGAATGSPSPFRRAKDGHEGFGCGLAWARYKNTGAWCAAAAEVEAGARVRVHRLAIAIDVGRVVSRDGVVAQAEGGAIQATSWTLKEAVGFDRTRVTSDAWERYPILAFSEVPSVDVDVIDRPGEPSRGAGEASLGPVAAAIGNALADALGVRVRDLPITPERVIAAMQ